MELIIQTLTNFVGLVENTLRVATDLYSQLPLLIQVPITFFVGGVIGRGIIAKKLSVWLELRYEQLSIKVKDRLIKTEKDIAVYLHFKNKALNAGHKHKTPVQCEDGLCKLFPKIER